MNEPIDAIFEHGVFRPLQGSPLGITEGQRVSITVNSATEPEIIRLATRVYEGLSPNEIDEIEAVALPRGSFFNPRNTP